MFVTVKGQFKTLKIHESPAYSLQCPSGVSHTDNKIQAYDHQLGSCVPSGPSTLCTLGPSTFLLSHSTCHICLPNSAKHAPPSGSSHLLLILLETRLFHSFPRLASCPRGLGSKVTPSPPGLATDPPQAPALSSDPPYGLDLSSWDVRAARPGALPRLHPLYSGIYNEQRPSHD